MSEQREQNESITSNKELDDYVTRWMDEGRGTVSEGDTTDETKDSNNKVYGGEDERADDQEATYAVFGHDGLPYVPIYRRNTAYFIPLSHLPLTQQMVIYNRYIIRTMAAFSEYKTHLLSPPVISLEQLQQLYPHINMKLKKSNQLDGKDLPYDDPTSLSFFYNAGLDCVKSLSPHCYILQPNDTSSDHSRNKDGFSFYPWYIEDQSRYNMFPSSTVSSDEGIKVEGTAATTGESGTTTGETGAKLEKARTTKVQTATTMVGTETSMAVPYPLYSAPGYYSYAPFPGAIPVVAGTGYPRPPIYNPVYRTQVPVTPIYKIPVSDPVYNTPTSYPSQY